jgi:hypothetical protein
MEAEDLINLGESLQAEQKKILDFYSKQTGTGIEQLEPLMQKATDLTSTQAVEMGFANEIITTSVNYKPYKLVAFVATENKPKQIKMNKNEQSVSWIKRSFTKLAAMINGVTLNMEMPVKDASGNEVLLYVESETEDLTGKSAYLLDADGNETLAPDGDYTDANNRIIKIAGGLVTEVVEAEAKKHDDEEETKMEDLIAKIAELETIKANLTSELESVKSDKSKAETEFNAFKNEFESLKKVVIGKGSNFQASEQDFTKKEATSDNSFGAWAINKIKNQN